MHGASAGPPYNPNGSTNLFNNSQALSVGNRCPNCGKRRSITNRYNFSRGPKQVVQREPLKLATVGAIGGTSPYPAH